MVNVVVDPVATYARSQPGRQACVDLESGRRWTYAELDRDVNKAAAWLVDELGPASGERVATLARNCTDMLILQIAAARAGAVFVPLNWRLSPIELAHLVGDCGPAKLFHDSDFAEAATAAAAGASPVLHDWSVGLATLAASEHDAPPPYARRAFDAPATFLYTSGTSGRPKGVVLSEANAFFSCANFIFGNQVSRDSVFLCDMPLFHTAGIFAATRTPIMAGGSVLISRGFDTGTTLARLTDPALAVSHYFSVPQMAQRIWQEPGFDPATLRHIQVWAVGGAPSPPAQLQRFLGAGIRMSDGFGMSETGSNFGMPMDDLQIAYDKAGSCGLPYVGIQPRVVGDDGADVEVGETGELWLAGPSITSGYWNNPEETAKAFVDGWFRTGDAATRDADGYYYLVDRKKDMYISGGENVYPVEVEAALAELDDVAEAAVVGVPDEKWGEVGRAYVIPRAGAKLDEETLRAHCLRRLAKYKVPASFVITDTIMRTASGKVQKHLLKQRAIQELAAKEKQDA
ncbi:MAG: AMP-binding protein [Sphingomonadales bacterium]